MAVGTAVPVNYWNLKKSEISQTMGKSALQRLAADMQTRNLERDEMMFPTGAGACLLLEGSVGVSRIDPATGKEIMLYMVKPGEFFGHAAPGGDGERPASVIRALQNSRVGVVDDARLRVLLADGKFRDEFQRHTESRLVHLENRIEELLFNRVKPRLARLLLRLSREFAERCPEGEGRMIAVTLTQNDIACLIAASREITSLTLNELKRVGVLGSHGRRICVHDEAALECLSGEG